MDIGLILIFVTISKCIMNKFPKYCFIFWRCLFRVDSRKWGFWVKEKNARTNLLDIKSHPIEFFTYHPRLRAPVSPQPPQQRMSSNI